MRLGERARKIDGGRRLAIRRRRAGDREDLQFGRLVELFDQVAKRPILFGFERGRREQAHQMLLDLELLLDLVRASA